VLEFVHDVIEDALARREDPRELAVAQRNKI